MKRKLIYIIFIIGSVIMTFSSCIKDEGNYDYLDKSVIDKLKISNIEEQMTALKGSLLEITPVIENMDDESKYSYSWVVLHDSRNSEEELAAVADTLSKEKNLSIDLSIPAKSYLLYFTVKDNETGFLTMNESRLTVTESEINYGYYILKNINGSTDIDYRGFTGAGDNVDDILTKYHGISPIKGKPVKGAFLDQQYVSLFPDEENPEIEVLNKKLSAFFLLTEEDALVINANNFSTPLKPSFDKMFYEAPTVVRPQNVVVFSMWTQFGLLFINDNKIYDLSDYYTTYGFFGYPLGNMAEAMNVHQNVLGSDHTALVYNLDDNNFYNFITMSSSPADKTPERIDINNKPEGTNLKLVDIYQNTTYDIFSSGGTIFGTAIFKDLNNSDYYYAEITMNLWALGGEFFFDINFAKMNSQSKILSSKLIFPTNNVGFLYYADGNKVMSYFNPSYGLSDGVVFECNADEVIVDIYSENINAGLLFPEKRIAVLTNSNDGWKLYQFAPTMDEQLGSPEAVYSGKGEAVSIAVRNLNLFAQ